MRRSELDRAEALFRALDAILPQHVPARGHRAEVALARGQLDLARKLIEPLVDASDDPEYRATYAEILAAAGEREASACEAERAAAAYELLLARRAEAYADHAAAFFMGIGNRPDRAMELAVFNWQQRDTPRSRRLLARACRSAAVSRGRRAPLSRDDGLCSVPNERVA
jgi:tetratricopeptide (TPR) repeat protein